MSTHATATDVSSLRTLYLALIDGMAYAASATVLAIWKLEATNALNLWADAKLAEQNINASAAANYAKGVGMAVTKARAAEKAGEARAHFDRFASFCLRGGVTVPSADDSIGLWDMRGLNA